MSKNKLEKVWDKEAKQRAEEFKNLSKQGIKKLDDPIIDWLLKEKKGSLLDAGCGIGRYTLYTKSLGFKPEGIDISKESIKLAKTYGLKVRVGDLRKLPFGNQSFDIVIAGGSVEHFPETEKAISEISIFLNKSGIFLGNVPHKYSIFSISRFLQQILGIWKSGYEKSFSIPQFKKLLKKHGFKKIEIKRTRISPGKYKFLSILLRILDEPLFIIGLGGAHFYFKAEK